MNKKQIWIVISVIAILIVVGLSGFFILKHQDKVRKEKEIAIKVENINKKMAPFKEAKKINSTDELSKSLNDLIDTHEKILKLSEDQDEVTIDNIKSLDDYEKTLTTEVNTASSYSFNNNIDSEINHYSKEEKRAIKEAYYNSKVVQSEDDDSRIKETYLSKKNNDLAFVKFLKDNKNNYYISKNKIIYKNDDFKTNFLKYNNTIELEKEVIKTSGIPILMYHGVLDNAWGDKSLFVKVNDFEKEIKYLSDNGYTSLFLSEINSAGNFKKPIVITFDDGYRDVYTYAFPILKKYNFKANFFVITDGVNKDVYVTDDMLKEMNSSGIFEIGSHTVGHVFLGNSTPEIQEQELKNSKEYLEQLLNKKIETIAYPYGSYNNTTLELVKKYYSYAVTIMPGHNVVNANPYTLKRIKINRNDSITLFAKKL